jgi:hypothetical protein
MNTENTIFRFKFSTEFNNQLLSFSKLHQHDDRQAYKDNWTLWLQSNNQIIDEESRRLREQGYNGNIIDKMYKSGRYYYRKKTPKQDPKKRRKYISIDSDVIEHMDKHIIDNANSPTFKPSSAFELFTNEFKELIEGETSRLLNKELPREDIKLKFKKTYKNRYFIFTQQKSNDNNSITSDITED